MKHQPTRQNAAESAQYLKRLAQALGVKRIGRGILPDGTKYTGGQRAVRARAVYFLGILERMGVTLVETSRDLNETRWETTKDGVRILVTELRWDGQISASVFLRAAETVGTTSPEAFHTKMQRLLQQPQDALNGWSMASKARNKTTKKLRFFSQITLGAEDAMTLAVPLQDRMKAAGFQPEGSWENRPGETSYRFAQPETGCVVVVKIVTFSTTTMQFMYVMLWTPAMKADLH